MINENGEVRSVVGLRSEYHVATNRYVTFSFDAAPRRHVARYRSVDLTNASRICARGEIKACCRDINSGSITTWEDLISKFINEFFHPSRTTNLRNEISNFQQKFDESFHEVWDRYKDLLRACPHHGFTELYQLDTFYNALNPADQDSLKFSAGGNLLERRTQDVLRIIENKSKVRNSRSKLIVSQLKSSDVNSSSFSDIAKLTHAVNEQTSAVTTAITTILKQFQYTPPPASVKDVEEICCASFLLVKLVMPPFAPKKFRMGVAIATGRRGYYKPGTRAWVSRIPISMYPCRVEERLTIELAEGREVEKIVTTVTKNGVVTRYPGKFQEYQLTDKEKEMERMMIYWDQVEYEVSDDDDSDLKSTARSVPKDYELEDTGDSSRN
ncbi:reverse transcriptase domain-containing protein [Tanacetum coccineum]